MKRALLPTEELIAFKSSFYLYMANSSVQVFNPKSGKTKTILEAEENVKLTNLIVRKNVLKPENNMELSYKRAHHPNKNLDNNNILYYGKQS